VLDDPGLEVRPAFAAVLGGLVENLSAAGISPKLGLEGVNHALVNDLLLD